MNLKYFSIAIFSLVGVLFGFVLASQLFFTTPYLKSNPFEPYNELQDSIRALSQEQETLQARLALLRDELANYDEVGVSAGLKNRLEKLKEELGLTELAGSGIKVTLDDNFAQSEEFSLAENICYAADLRDIINLVRMAGSDGIAVNGQRVTYATPMACVGNSVLVNNVRMLPPFEVAVVSNNTRVLGSYLNTEKFLPQIYNRLKNEEVVFLVEEKDEIVLPSYKGRLSFDYLRKADEV